MRPSPTTDPSIPSIRWKHTQRLGLEGTAEGDAALAPWRAKIDESYLDELGATLEAKAVEVRASVVELLSV